MTQETIELIKYLKKNVSDITILSPREKGVLRLRFGLDDGVMRTLEETGKEFGVTRERVRQIQAKALELARRWKNA